jgi:hypothetical protein
MLKRYCTGLWNEMLNNKISHLQSYDFEVFLHTHIRSQQTRTRTCTRTHAFYHVRDDFAMPREVCYYVQQRGRDRFTMTRNTFRMSGVRFTITDQTTWLPNATICVQQSTWNKSGLEYTQRDLK